MDIHHLWDGLEKPFYGKALTHKNTPISMA
jgi:hypothetical protein